MDRLLTYAQLLEYLNAIGIVYSNFLDQRVYNARIDDYGNLIITLEDGTVAVPLAKR